MNRRAMSKLVPILAALALPLALTACGADTPAERPPLEGARIGGPFTLSDKDGKPVNWSDFDGKYRIVYFGYTFCPDACPMDVALAMRGFERFKARHPDLAAQVRPLFISIDPERDTPARVGEFAAAFSPDLTGLTGTPEQVAAAAKAFGAYYAKGKPAGDGYLMDHSRAAYLMGRKGEPIALLPVDSKDPEAVASELAKWVK